VNGSVRPSAPGLYEFTSRGAKKIFAVNPPVEESDLSPWPNPESTRSPRIAGRPAGRGPRERAAGGMGDGREPATALVVAARRRRLCAAR